MKKKKFQGDLVGVLFAEKLLIIIVKNKDNLFVHICAN